ncbi:exo-beta-N-acetylmuramidase NamZ family protein [Clostridium sp.]|uniref:exo-beta-N-acetylmuramidase NamZ family protein n=1 Tax=Clostridium sp. TaxID=1506 RepID=UPI003D6C72D3
MKTVVNNGIDNLEEYAEIFSGKRLGLITGPTGVNKKLISTIDILHEKYNLVALFSPEHGVRGDIQAGVKVDDYLDLATGIPVYSLYGDKKKITKEMLCKIDLLVFDIQDVGARFYTFLYTLTYAMEACNENSKPIVVLDRINPLGGKIVQGNILENGFESFVGKYPIPTRYGLTIGEFALYINSKFKINADLTVVPCTGWNRDLYYDDTDLVWVQPSPNIPTIDTAFIYSGTCIFEGTNLSEGRGTTKPFEIIGAPWLDNIKLVSIMNFKKYSGVMFREVYFTPTFSKHANILCSGIQIHVTQRDEFNPFVLALDILLEIKNMHSGEFVFIPPLANGAQPFINLITGTDKVVNNMGGLNELLEKMDVNLEEYIEEKKMYELY